jgi:hypothetical protein
MYMTFFIKNINCVSLKFGVSLLLWNLGFCQGSKTCIVIMDSIFVGKVIMI